MAATAKSTVRQGELVIDNGEMELEELLEREGRIERAQRNAYYEIGLDLQAIRDKCGYKTKRSVAVAGRYSFTTFEEYLEERWSMEYRRCKHLMDAAAVVEKLNNCSTFVPVHESHVRELLKLETDQDRAAVWQRLVDRGETIRAKDVEAEVARFKAEKEKDWLTLAEWEATSEEDRDRLLNTKSTKTFNKQDDENIGWAKWSWNPVTGCKHDCPYCYARDIAKRFYPQEFEPSIYPSRLWSPANTTVPDKASEDIAFKNVFACSMADLFGRWVPAEWIQLVLDEVKDNPQWNFLMLTKFPKRMAEFTIPKNAWMGTTVDCQSRVNATEQAFQKVGSKIKWLSIEPMLTPLKFKSLELFNWVVIGGASASTQTPKWVPPFDWVADLHIQARAAGCAIYHKTNLDMEDGIRLKEFPWQRNPQRALPEALRYLDIKKTSD